jgi:hypothetical protein
MRAAKYDLAMEASADVVSKVDFSRIRPGKGLARGVISLRSFDPTVIFLTSSQSS